jgi:lipopolysaccharide export LptBFGC system permease protein LptF
MARDERQFLMLNNGQRLESNPTTGRIKVSQFEQYGAQIGAAASYIRTGLALKARSTWTLIREPTPAHMGELGWRVGVALTAFNLVLLGVATTVSNPRAGRSGNLLFTLFAFIVYFNLLNVGQRWVTAGQVNWLVLTAAAARLCVCVQRTVAGQAAPQHPLAQLAAPHGARRRCGSRGMKTIRRLIYGEVLIATGYVLLAFLSLFFFFDFVEELGAMGSLPGWIRRCPTNSRTPCCTWPC